jgi:hypothetical protein
MTDISDLSGKGLPSSATLLKASAIALLVAIVVLLIAVLLAEYGIDPTGIGNRLGLTAMSNAADDDDGETVPTPSETQTAIAEPVSSLNAVWKSATPYRTDEMSVTLAPNEGAEIKARMQNGERLVFAWVTSGGGVNFDMHGEELHAANDEFTSYWKGRDEASGNGAFVAPFAGTHGWYWRNRGNSSVTVTVKTSGYYEKLYRP